MDRKPWKTWSVSNNTQMKWAHLQYSHTIKRLIHKHRYDSAHTCVFVCVCVREKRPPGVEHWIYGVMGCFYDNAPGFVSLRGSILTGGHIAILGPSGRVCPGFGVATTTATAFPISWPLETSGPPRQLSAQLSCRHRQTDISSSVPSCAVASSWVLTRVGCLTFQILILLAHGPHADLFVDHVDTREAVLDTGWSVRVRVCPRVTKTSHWALPEVECD